MKTIKALSVAVSLLMAADGYVITQASAAPVPVKPLVTIDNMIEQVRHGDGGRRGGGSVEWRRRHGGGSYMRHGGDYRRHGDYRRYGGDYRRYGGDYRRHRDYRRYGGDYRRHRDYRHYGNYRRHRHNNNNYYFASPWLGVAPLAFGLGYGYGDYGYDYGYSGYPTSIVEWCTRRYRSYNPATGMYYTGTRWKVCRPY